MDLPLFDQKQNGTEARDRGMKSVLAHTDEGFKSRFIEAIEGFERGHLFTVEDVRAIVGDPPPGTHFNCVGALTRTAACRGLMRKTGTFVKAKRASLHASELAVWAKL